VSANAITWKKLGLIEYSKCLEMQRNAHAACVADPNKQIIFSLEHPPVITLGLRQEQKHLLFSEQQLLEKGIGLCTTERGGHATIHMPGQLVVYPIVHLPSLRLMPKLYVKVVEQAVIDVLASLGVAAQRDEEFPGVWVGSQKICAIGVRIKDRVSMHGLALNVCNDLGLFSTIIPCGIKNRGVCSLASLGSDESFDRVELSIVSRLQELLTRRSC